MFTDDPFYSDNGALLSSLTAQTPSSARRLFHHGCLPPQTQNPALAVTLTSDVFLALEIPSLTSGTFKEQPRTFGTLSETTLNNVVLSRYFRTGCNLLQIRSADFESVALHGL
jgi:hypothetical protein